MSNVAIIDTGYRPRPIQADLHRKIKRFNVLVCHRRFGKSVFEVNRMIDASLRCQLQFPQYGYFAPFRDQCKRIAWQYLKRFTENFPNRDVNEAELRVDLPRPHMKDFARIQLFGADNMPALKGVYFDGAGLDEFAEMSPDVWIEAIRPTLSDRKGWADLLGTPKGQNHFYERYEYGKHSGDPNWFSALYKSSETGIIDAQEIADLKRDMSPEKFEQEYECSFVAALVGAYFARAMAEADRDNRITDVPYDPGLPVDTYWDLGISDATAIWFIQSQRGQHRAIDYLELTEASLNDVAREIEKRKYSYLGSSTVLPHDAQARDLSTGKTRVQTLSSLGFRNLRVVPRVGAKMESIEAARRIIPKTVFDRKKCHRGIQALLNYTKKWNEKTQAFGENPEHTQWSHGSDAFQTFAMGSREDSRDTVSEFMAANQSRTRPGELVAVTDWDLYA